MAIFSSYLQGAQAKQSKQASEQAGQMRGMQMEDILSDRRRTTAQQARTDRLTGLRTDYLSGQGDPQAQAEIKRKIFAISPEEHAQLSDFESDEEARQSEVWGRNAVDFSASIGQPNEAQALDDYLRANMDAGRNPEQMDMIAQRYSSIQDPNAKTDFLINMVDRDLMQGDYGRKYLEAKRANVPEDPKQRRIITGADKLKYYADTGERVLPDVIPAPDTSGVTVNVGGKQTTLSPAAEERYTLAKNTIKSASENEQSYAKLLDVVSKVDTGTFAEYKIDAMKTMQALGVDVDAETIANAEQLRSLAMGEVLKLIGQTKGAISEKEMDAFERASVNLGNSPAGNALLAKAGLEAARRTKQIAQGMKKYVRDNPQADIFEIDDEEERLTAEMAEKSIFTDEEIETLNRIGGGAGVAPPAITLSTEDQALVDKWTNP